MAKEIQTEEQEKLEHLLVRRLQDKNFREFNFAELKNDLAQKVVKNNKISISNFDKKI